MTAFSDEDVHRIRVALGRISRRVDRSSAEDGLTRSQFLLLSTVARRGPIGVRELAEIEGLNPTMLSRIVGKMAESGLLVREGGAADRRVVAVRVTDAGRELYERLRARRTEVFAEHLAGISHEHAADLLRALPALEALAEHLPAVGT
ncbi:MarR family winged helix-turn-helix transcriptional regulator [Tomitella biformata]|uniref:MarR family winged helix-turn-helix transcriptional regulator n=1 Tax=Tomitella biformata TaxID=630403 RepID=UPI000465C5A6|nr:MarR family transcriptional regulator [Tomitella biformata]